MTDEEEAQKIAQELLEKFKKGVSIFKKNAKTAALFFIDQMILQSVIFDAFQKEYMPPDKFKSKVEHWKRVKSKVEKM